MVTNALLQYARSDRAAPDLACYLTCYTGRLFDKWARPDLDHFVADDILAVKALSVEVPAEATDRLLTDVNGNFSRLLGLLGEFSIDRSMNHWEVAANELHDALKRLDGVGSVIAGKLMHAKLPRLVPIWDANTARGLPYAEGAYWAGWHRDYKTNVVDAVEQLRHAVPAAQGLHDLRILDIVIWMANEPERPTSASTHPCRRSPI